MVLEVEERVRADGGALPSVKGEMRLYAYAQVVGRSWRGKREGDLQNAVAQLRTGGALAVGR